MSQVVEATAVKTQPLEWLSLKSFTASTTFSEKVSRVFNNLVFVATGLSLYAIGSRKIRQAPPALSYASYVVVALAVRKIVSTIIGFIVYPATLIFNKNTLAEQEKKEIELLSKKEFITRKITLYKSGIAYDATIIGHKDTINNRKWVVHAFGNAMAMEQRTNQISQDNKHHYKANTLLINGPAVGRSQGFPTRYQMSAGFEAGLQFLEKEVKATHIAFKGLSLGGGMMAEAVLNHKFDKEVKYLGISDRTFSYLSDAAAALVGRIVTPFFYLSGAQLDGVSGAEKLKQLKIDHIIIQHVSKENQGDDGVIPDRVSLAPKLEKAPNRTFLLSSEIEHNESLPYEIDHQLDEIVASFFAKD